MIKRIAITGPESSGKTSLAEDLASHFKTNYAPEFAREFLMKNKNYNQQDLDIIAQGQLDEIKKIETNRIVISDTDMLVLKIWSLVVFKSVSAFIEESLSRQQFDLYILCSPDIPWEYDPLRVDEHNRDELFELYYKEIIANNYNYIIVNGSKKQRLSQVLKYLSETR